MRISTPVLIVVTCVSLWAKADVAQGTVPTRLSGIAAASVLAVKGPGGATETGFSLDAPQQVVLPVASGGSPSLIDSGGSTGRTTPAGTYGSLALARTSGLSLSPLHPARRFSRATATYVLGPPLGYEANRIRRVRLPRMSLSSRRLATVGGTLPAADLGAPVVTAGGRLVGAVAAVRSRSWRLAPLGMVRRLLLARRPSGSSGPPILPLLGGALLVFLGGVAFGLLRARRVRERRTEAAVRRMRRAQTSEPVTEPLVLRRESESPNPASDGEDFEVIIKPQEQQ